MRSIVTLGACLLLAACASSESKAPCVHPTARPFGAHSERFGNEVANAPSGLGEHVSYRLERLGAALGIIGSQTAGDASQSADHATSGFASLLGNEFGRVNNIGDFAAQGAQRNSDDARCFFARAWFDLKLLE